MLTAFFLNSRLSAELIILAPTKEVADNSFNPIRDAIKADPELDEMMTTSEHTKTITHQGTQATLKVVAADDKSTGGKKPLGSWLMSCIYFKPCPMLVRCFVKQLVVWHLVTRVV